MVASLADRSPVAAPELTAMRDELRQEALTLALTGLSVAGFLLFAAMPYFSHLARGMALGILLWMVPLLGRLMVSRNYYLAAWWLVLGCGVIVLLAVFWGDMPLAIYFLIVPTGLAVLLFGGLEGALVAGLSTVLLWRLPAEILPLSGEVRTMVALVLWTSLSLLWLTTQPLLTSLNWAWGSYAQNRRLLERARDAQVRLKQALADLADANLQLTRLNRLAEGLRRAADEARKSKEEFVANVSHELRTPLNMIIGFAQMMVEEPDTYEGAIPPALAADLEVILRNARHLSGLIDDVLDLSQMEAGQMALIKERVKLAEVIEDAIIAVRPLFESKSLYLRTEIPADLPPIFCDATRIREVVLNLLSNAGRFTEKGGVVLRAWQEGQDVVVSVTDTGPGIAEEDKVKLFKPFQQLDGSVRRRYGGTGLGLTISKGFVEAHGGTMWLESTVGHGATFFFRLPIEPPLPSQKDVTRWLDGSWEYRQRTRRPLVRPALVPPRLVVWEKGDTLQRLLNRHLDGAEIVAAADLDRALHELARTPSRALMVNDASIPEALQRLAALPQLPYDTPAIICSLPGAHEAAGALGVAGYLVKPVSREALVEALGRLKLKGKTILVVDNEPETLRLFWRLLASPQYGYNVLTASDGRQALHLLRERRPDAMLLDLLMPEMDGFQLLAEIKQDAMLRDLPIIIVSARDPVGHAILSNALAIWHKGGLSLQQILACTEAVIGPLMAPSPVGAATSATAPPG